MPPIKQKRQQYRSIQESSLPELKLRYRALKKRSVALDKEIAQLKAEGVTEDLKPEMQALHEYNDIKDVTQMILGRLADLELCTVAELHRKYDLPLE